MTVYKRTLNLINRLCCYMLQGDSNVSKEIYKPWLQANIYEICGWHIDTWTGLSTKKIPVSFVMFT
jgi:hypothetical protein